ncbi:uncharacterized protein METZ01_LOCUS459579, partial [marine metagenome]
VDDISKAAFAFVYICANDEIFAIAGLTSDTGQN